MTTGCPTLTLVVAVDSHPASHMLTPDMPVDDALWSSCCARHRALAESARVNFKRLQQSRVLIHKPTCQVRMGNL